MTFALAELVFLLSGVLLVVFALVSKADINATPTLSNVSRHLVLSLGPGTGQSTKSSCLMSVTNKPDSCVRKCWGRLFYVPTLYSRHVDANVAGVVEAARVHDRCVRTLLTCPGIVHLD
jgi:hypothetical protein